MEFVIFGAFMGFMFGLEFVIAASGFWVLNKIEKRNARCIKTTVKLGSVVFGFLVLMATLLGVIMAGAQEILS